MEPVQIEHRRDHKFVPKDKSQKHPRCAECGRGKGNVAHVGTPTSLNVFASSRSEFVYLNAKKMWEQALWDLLEPTDLPKPCDRILVEGECCFPDRQSRDQGNYRFILEKALGDVLQLGGWLENDDWQHYEFGNLAYAYAKGESWTRLTLMPMQVRVFDDAPAPKAVPAPQDTALFTPA